MSKEDRRFKKKKKKIEFKSTGLNKEDFKKIFEESEKISREVKSIVDRNL